MYADYAYYISGYLLGKSPAVPEGEFPYWERQARVEIDQATQNRVRKNPALADENVKDCVCAIAEHLYKVDRLTGGGDMPGPLVSYNNDGDSGTFDLSKSGYTQSGVKGKIRGLIEQHLSGKGLLFAGGVHYER